MATMPELTTTGQELYDGIAPLMQPDTDVEGYSDADNEYVGAILCGALATMVDPVSDIVRDQADGTPGYAILFDPEQLVDIGRPEWLPWLAQFIGDSQAVLAAPNVETQLAIIAQPMNFFAGRPATIKAAAQTTLTGAATVILTQFLNNDPNQVGVTTYSAQTPSPQATVNAVLSVLPAWIVPTFIVTAGGTYSMLPAAHPTYSALKAAHSTYLNLAQHPSA